MPKTLNPNKYFPQDISNLQAVLYDAQFDISILQNFPNKNNYVEFEILRPDFNRKKHKTYLIFFKTTLVPTTKSIFRVREAREVTIKEKPNNINIKMKGFETIYDIMLNDNELIIETQNFYIHIQTIGFHATLQDEYLYDEVYLRISGWI